MLDRKGSAPADDTILNSALDSGASRAPFDGHTYPIIWDLLVTGDPLVVLVLASDGKPRREDAAAEDALGVLGSVVCHEAVLQDVSRLHRGQDISALAAHHERVRSRLDKYTREWTWGLSAMKESYGASMAAAVPLKKNLLFAT